MAAPGRGFPAPLWRAGGLRALFLAFFEAGQLRLSRVRLDRAGAARTGGLMSFGRIWITIGGATVAAAPDGQSTMADGKVCIEIWEVTSSRILAAAPPHSRRVRAAPGCVDAKQGCGGGASDQCGRSRRARAAMVVWACGWVRGDAIMIEPRCDEAPPTRLGNPRALALCSSRKQCSCLLYSMTQLSKSAAAGLGL